MIANLRPSGEFLMEDFYYAGGLRALLKQITTLLHLDCLTVSGETLGKGFESAQVFNEQVIRCLDNPVSTSGGTGVLYGNLAPDDRRRPHVACPLPLLHLFDAADHRAAAR